MILGTILKFVIAYYYPHKPQANFFRLSSSILEQVFHFIIFIIHCIVFQN